MAVLSSAKSIEALKEFGYTNHRLLNNQVVSNSELSMKFLNTLFGSIFVSNRLNDGQLKFFFITLQFFF